MSHERNDRETSKIVLFKAIGDLKARQHQMNKDQSELLKLVDEAYTTAKLEHSGEEIERSLNDLFQTEHKYMGAIYDIKNPKGDLAFAFSNNKMKLVFDGVDQKGW